MKELLRLLLFLFIIRPWSKKENELGGTFMQGMAQKKKDGKVLDFIERVGNQLPHPYILFLWLCLILALISMVCSMAGVSVVNPTNGETVLAKSLISKDGLIRLLENLLSNFQGFSPLGLVLAMQIAIGFSEKVGIICMSSMGIYIQFAHGKIKSDCGFYWPDFMSRFFCRIQ